MIPVLLSGLVLSISLWGCQGTAQKETDAEEPLPELTIGVDILAPFFYMGENGTYVGIDEEIAEEACRRAGYEPVFTEIPWSERDSYLEEESVDCLWTAFIEDGREDSYLWTEPYLESRLAVVTDEQAPDKDMESFHGTGGIAVRAGARVEEFFLKNFLEVKIYSCGTFQMAENAFIKGYANALAGHRAVLQQFMDDYPGMYRYLSDDLMTVNLGVAFKKNGETAGWEKINEALKEMKEDGSIAAVAEKYGMNDSEEETADEEN